MVRTQMYPTDRQRTELEIISKTLGKKQSELIREAVDRLIDQKRLSRRESALREAAGIWKDREDLPDFRAIRSEWDFLFTVVPVTAEIARAGAFINVNMPNHMEPASKTPSSLLRVNLKMRF